MRELDYNPKNTRTTEIVFIQPRPPNSNIRTICRGKMMEDQKL